ncbi:MULTISPECIES: TonB-dependent receptor plug domain-containing protein [unclassified Carboxylicivirga]|uniref:TonB-dependent receptor plug domain-containing protein n=1 Tax=Carboxylicivirga TaxID=1628153 RepID=UPI003D3538F5
MNKLITISVYLWLTSVAAVNAQSLEVNCQAMPLNELLIQWRGEYKLQFSFNDAQLAQYAITCTAHFDSVDEALNTLLKAYPLSFEKHGEVYIIYRRKPADTPAMLYGKVVEYGSGESLPFSHVSAGGRQTVADQNGVFNLSFQSDSAQDVIVSHLGCYLLDTLLTPGQLHVLSLQPSAVGLKEVIVTNNMVEKAAQLGQVAGLLHLNHHIAHYLPGNGDNSVFNLLRLQPGILATGEQANDLVIWGSPEGTSRVIFDGFTIWGLNNFNDNISAVNPYMAKHIEVYKGAYGARLPDVTGGIVNIIGKNGSTKQPGFNVFVNNQTINGMLELPLLKKSSVMLAFRQSYHNLLRADDVINEAQTFNINQVDVTPDYQFHDFNFKYSYQGDRNTLFYISLLKGNDEFVMRTAQTYGRGRWQQEVVQDKQQMGGTISYSKSWSNGYSSSLRVSYSTLQSYYNLQQAIERGKNKNDRHIRDEEAHNDIIESTVSWEHRIPAGSHHEITTGLEYVHNQVVLREDTFSNTYIDLSERANRLSYYIEDAVQLSPQIKLIAGLRYKHFFFLSKNYINPRLALSVQPAPKIKLQASWGLYHQYLVKSSIEDESGNYRYSWTIADDDEIPVIESQHYVLGLAYTPDDFLASIEAFYKSYKGLTRFVRSDLISNLYNGDSRSYGMDIYLKKDFGHHTFWTSYTLSRAEEYYPFFTTEEYQRTPQDQRHELKIAGLLNFGPFHLSAAYVYGSGFPYYRNYLLQENVNKDYQRLDAALVYRLSRRKFTGEAGLSLMNVFDTNNIKYNQFNVVPLDQVNTVYVNTSALGFTPLLYLKVKF